MTIKEVEKATGLTAKSIRLYEKKGLINVKRDESNDYRKYTEENITQLKWIKLYRYLDFSIEEISELLELPKEHLESRFIKKQQMFMEQIDEIEHKKVILIDLASQISKESVQIDEYVETIDFLEGEDSEEIRSLFRDWKIPTLTECFWLSLICVGPIGMLFIHIYERKWTVLPWNTILALVAVSIMTIVWKEYFSARKLYKHEMKEKNKSQVKIWPFMIFSFIVAFALIVVVTVKAEKILAPEKWLFYEMHSLAETSMILISVCGSAVFVYCIYRILLRSKMIKYIKTAFITVFVVLFCLCCCLINVTYVTEENIIVRTLLHPGGNKYDYEEIEKVEAGFGTKRIALFESNRRGEFSYKIYLDNRTIVFSAPSTNETIERYNENTYLELEEFDERLMNIGIHKDADKEYSKYCELDDEYVERFVRIVENQSK